jgi:hypothetical protein
MFIIYELAACLCAAVLVATVMFAACVIFLGLKEAGHRVARTLPKLPPSTSWLPGTRVVPEPREP